MFGTTRGRRGRPVTNPGHKKDAGQLCCLDGGALILSNCSRALEEGDGRSGWTFQANSQLRLAKAGSWCMTQKNVNGSTAGVVDLIASSGITAESSSSADEAHGAQKAVDRDTNTSWDSESFDDTGDHLVTFDVNIGQ